MFPFDCSDFPQQQTFLPNFPCSFTHERNPLHHQNLPHQMGIYFPQTLYQDPNTFTISSNDQYTSPIPNLSPVYGFTCNQASQGLSPAKKDRHSKISTAHGVRDRRVRLSMAIAREFFDLQDMLGFDKASNTIGWLLAKSKSAIQEVSVARRGPGLSRSSSLSSSPYEDAFANSSTDTLTRKRSVSSTTLARHRSWKSSASGSKEEIERTSTLENQANSIVLRENRAKARARARERTRDKLCTVAKPTQFDDLGQHTSCSSHLLADSNSQGFSMSLHDQNLDAPNLIRSRNDCTDCTDYLQSLITAPSVDQGGSVRVNHLPSTLAMGSNNNSEARTMCSSFSGWNIFNFPSEMHMTSKPWENQDQYQSCSQHTVDR